MKFSELLFFLNGASEMEFKILFGCLNMDDLPQTDDEIRDLKSINTGMIQKLKFKQIEAR